MMLRGPQEAKEKSSKTLDTCHLESGKIMKFLLFLLLIDVVETMEQM